MPRTYRIGVIGSTGRGNYGHGLDRVWRELPNATVVAVADDDPTGLADACKRLKVDAGFADWRHMLDEARPDIVAICPRWLDRHAEMAVAAAERGIHIYIEKPMCRSLEEADRIVAACEKNKVKLAIAHQRRYSGTFNVIRDLIEAGHIGRVIELRGRGKEDRRGGGEDLWVLGCHVMNMIHHFGGEPRSCFAIVEQDGKPVTRDDVYDGAEGIGPLAGDTVAAMYNLDNGVKAYFNSVRNAGTRPYRFGLRLLGANGQIDIAADALPYAYLLEDPLWSPGRSSANWRRISSVGLDQPDPNPDAGLHEGNIDACRDLIAAIEADRLPECNVYEGRMTIEMIAAVFESHRVRGPVSLPLTNRRNPLTML